MFSLSQIFYGRFRSAYLGYYAFVPFAGQGYMREGLAPAAALRVRRSAACTASQANIQPENERSIALRAGRRLPAREGSRRATCKIGGRWRDHEHWAILAEDPRGRAV